MRLLLLFYNFLCRPTWWYLGKTHFDVVWWWQFMFRVLAIISFKMFYLHYFYPVFFSPLMWASLGFSPWLPRKKSPRWWVLNIHLGFVSIWSPLGIDSFIDVVCKEGHSLSKFLDATLFFCQWFQISVWLEISVFSTLKQFLLYGNLILEFNGFINTDKFLGWNIST